MCGSRAWRCPRRAPPGASRAGTHSRRGGGGATYPSADRASRCARREHVLPAPLARRVRILARQRVGQIHRAEARRQVALVQRARALQMRAAAAAEPRAASSRGPCALAVAHHDLAPREVDVLHPQAHALHQPQAGAVQQAGRSAACVPSQARSSARTSVAGQHHRQARAASSPAPDSSSHGSSTPSTSLVQEQQRAQRLVLRGGRDVAAARRDG